MEKETVNRKKTSSLLATCYICKSSYTNPKVLSCCHTFCEGCLQESDPCQGLSLHCIICGHQSILPKGGVGELRSNPFIDRIMQSLIEDTEGPVLVTNVTDVSELHSNMANEDYEEDHTLALSLEASRENSMLCGSPCNKPVTMYCQSCDMVVCKDCAKFEHVKHHGAVTTLRSLSADCEESLLKQADTLEQKMSPLQKALRDITHIIEDLDNNKDASQKLVNDSFDQLERLLSQRRFDLLRGIDSAYNVKRTKLVEQADHVEKFVRSMEEGLDVIIQSLSSKLTPSPSVELNNGNGDRGVDRCSSEGDTTAFFVHKQVSKTIDDLCKYRFESNEGRLKKNDSTDTVSEHSVRLSDAHASQAYNAPVQLTVPCENSHIAVLNMQNVTKIDHLVSNMGSVETSHAVAQKSVLSGECITTGYCKAEVENSIILTAKTWSGELETSGKVLATVDIDYVGPPDKEDQIMYRTSSPSSRSNLSHRKTWDGTRSPTSLYGSRTNLSSGMKYSVKRSSKPNSPSPSGGRSPLKDLFLHTSLDENSSPTPQYDIDSESPYVTHRIDYIKNGAYEIAFTPPIPGKYKISVALYGRAVPHGSLVVTAINMKQKMNSRIRTSRMESPSPMRQQSVRQKGMKRPPSSNGPRKNPIEDDLVLKVGSRGRGKGQFSNPQGVSIDHLGRLLVADSANQCIQVFSVSPKKTREPKQLFRFGEKGRGSGQVQRPTGVYGLPNGDIAVSDYDNKVVKIYGEDGKNKLNIGSGKLMGPKGVCMDQNGHIVVVDNKLCQVFVFQVNGRLITKFGSRGTEPHQLAGPHFVAVNNDNFFYISDFYNHCVKIFSSRGDCISVIGSTGEGCGQFNAPTGLTIDSRGNIIVADWGNSRLQVFDKHGSFLSYISTNEDPLYGPQGVTLLQDEYIAVADSGNQCIKIYRYLQ